MEELDSEPGKFVHVEKTWTCPVFALVVREEGLHKEALLVIRGSATALDWTINLNCIPSQITYYKGAQGDEGELKGSVQSGMHRGAISILEHCHMAAAIDMLLSQGYSIKVVGHSLGAGVAAMCVILLKERYVLQLREKKRTSVPFIPSVGFGCPPCTDIEISEALKEDNLTTTVINNDDMVPRLSEANMIPLSEEVLEYKDTALMLFEEDKAALLKYTKKLGPSGRLNVDKGSEENLNKLTSNTSNTLKKDNNDKNDLSPQKGKGKEKDSDVTADLAAFDNNDDLEEHGENENDSSFLDEKGGASTDGRMPNGANDANDVSSLYSSPCDWEENDALRHVRLAVPGQVVLVGPGTNGRVRAVMTTHDAPTLHSIKMLDHARDDHDTKAYVVSLTQASIGFESARAKSNSIHSTNSRPGSPASTVGVVVGVGATTSAAGGPAGGSGTGKGGGAVGIEMPKLARMVSQEGYETASTSTRGSLINNFDEQKYKNCSVCKEDVTWPYLTSSDACRATATQNCGACGKIVCNICAPAGESIPGEGVNQTIVLDDLRLPLPSRNLYTPQRLCMWICEYVDM